MALALPLAQLCRRWNAEAPLDVALGVNRLEAARFVLSLESALPIDPSTLERAGLWVVDGDPYCLSVLQPQPPASPACGAGFLALIMPRS
jgi:hypothetical protein